jgi:rare lipoprotein A
MNIKTFLLTAIATVAAIGTGCSNSPPRENPRSEHPVPPERPAPEHPAPVMQDPSPTSLPPPPENLEFIPDAVPREEPRSARGNPLSYEVFGQRYFILPTSVGYKERGVASWYGPTFHTRPTSSGEPYDMYAMTAAHKTLPIPAYARVTHLGNGRSVVVRINDRGPFVGNRIIDLSYTAAHKLDMARAGTAAVEVEVITAGSLQEAARGIASAQTPPPMNAPPLHIQAGAFRSISNADQRARQLRAAGIDRVTIQLVPNTESLYRIRVGPIESIADFDAVTAKLSAMGIESRLVTD